jgi:hypothetical protein
MSQDKFKPAYILSVIIAILMIVASAGGLFIDGLYRDNTYLHLYRLWLGQFPKPRIIRSRIFKIGTIDRKLSQGENPAFWHIFQ